MKATLALLAAPLAVFAAATPKPELSASGTFVAGAWNTDPHKGPIFTGDRVNASGGKFYINRPTSTYCPEGIEGLDCSHFSGTKTVFGIGEGVSSVSLEVTVPGGQQVYVAPDGSLSFTQAHSAYIPPGSTVTGFTRETKGKLFLHLEGKEFYLCPVTAEKTVQKKTYQVFAFSEPHKDCLATNLRTYKPCDQAVWQYA